MNIVNLTPHPLTLRNPETGADTIVPPSGTVARVTATPGAVENVSGIPVPVGRPDIFGDVEGLPEPQEGTIYLVSAMVGGRVARRDVFTPGTGPKDEAVRNDKGHVVAVTRIKATMVC